MYCKNCEHWRMLPTEGDGDGQCHNDEKFIYRYDESLKGKPTPIDGLSYWDSEGYLAGFVTGPNFGRIHFAKKVDE